MFSYRHAFHAGNHADVLKHLTLIAVMRHLIQKDKGLMLIDTHAGAGLYRLDGDYAAQSGEARDGVEKILAAAAAAVTTSPAQPGVALAPALQDYVDLVRGFNPRGGAKVYPGSPLVLQQLMRPDSDDRLRLFELHPTDSKNLAGHVAQLAMPRQITLAQEDGFEALKRMLPPPGRRALVLVDPSYEIKTDYARVAACLQDSLRRFATGTYLVWYPVIPRMQAHDLPRRLKTLATQAQRPWLQATLSIGQPPLDSTRSGSARPGLCASGMFVVNPPHTLRAALAQALPQLLQLLRRGPGASQSLTAGSRSQRPAPRG